jgi:hypothetical protein
MIDQENQDYHPQSLSEESGQEAGRAAPEKRMIPEKSFEDWR